MTQAATYNYRTAILKFNSGRGALLCNGCYTVLATGFDHEDTQHFCVKCTCKRALTGVPPNHVNLR